jgi:glucokinase
MWTLSSSDINRAGGKTAFLAMKQGDKAGQEVVDMYIKYLACGLANIINIFAPEIICIGGGVCNEGEYLTKPLEAYIDKEIYTRDSSKKTKIKIAALGNDAGIIGAAMMGKQF